jgi:hypothetical protein
LNGDRDKEIVSFLVSNGVDISNTVTNDIDLLVCSNKDSNSGKLVNARKKSKRILDICEFKNEYIKLK